MQFTFFLAEKLHMTVDELLHRIGNREFVEWSMYYARERQREELGMKMAKHGR